ncbi:uncharacterized protein LOC127784038 isoform X2 [Oryza glaberrima]|uniref:uncharacterized protein LOC127771217 isoform X2 n=1 Tax=Oryza glaberrima TaxID=4538 RepID=UPI00224BE69A|nr:uncharacterized protein LOC127771217 isoform X2 [Oryza glaberrima]XP_052167176.1 uncharacterized protein LOC127784038 isoform X2 [Oryza glaberrima]
MPFIFVASPFPIFLASSPCLGWGPRHPLQQLPCCVMGSRAHSLKNQPRLEWEVGLSICDGKQAQRYQMAGASTQTIINNIRFWDCASVSSKQGLVISFAAWWATLFLNVCLLNEVTESYIKELAARSRKVQHGRQANTLEL